MSRRHIRLMVLSVLVVAFTAIGAVVFAEWLATGTGEGSAAAGTAVELRVEPVAGVGGEAQLLVPGGSGDVEAVIVNDNPYDVEVRTIAQDGPITSNQAGCDETTGEVTYATQTGSWIIPANGDLSVRLTDALAMGVDAADACQGAEFTVPLAVTGGSDVGATTTLPAGSPEVCDLLDNDLNGLVDDGLGDYCLGGLPAANTDGDSACDAGWFDLDADAANGCETTPSDPMPNCTDFNEPENDPNPSLDPSNFGVGGLVTPAEAATISGGLCHYSDPGDRYLISFEDPTSPGPGCTIGETFTYEAAIEYTAGPSGGPVFFHWQIASDDFGPSYSDPIPTQSGGDGFADPGETETMTLTWTVECVDVDTLDGDPNVPIAVEPMVYVETPETDYPFNTYTFTASLTTAP